MVDKFNSMFTPFNQQQQQTIQKLPEIPQGQLYQQQNMQAVLQSQQQPMHFQSYGLLQQQQPQPWIQFKHPIGPISQFVPVQAVATPQKTYPSVVGTNEVNDNNNNTISNFFYSYPYQQVPYLTTLPQNIQPIPNNNATVPTHFPTNYQSSNVIYQHTQPSEKSINNNMNSASNSIMAPYQQTNQILNNSSSNIENENNSGSSILTNVGNNQINNNTQSFNYLPMQTIPVGVPIQNMQNNYNTINTVNNTNNNNNTNNTNNNNNTATTINNNNNSYNINNKKNESQEIPLNVSIPISVPMPTMHVPLSTVPMQQLPIQQPIPINVPINNNMNMPFHVPYQIQPSQHMQHMQSMQPIPMQRMHTMPMMHIPVQHMPVQHMPIEDINYNSNTNNPNNNNNDNTTTTALITTNISTTNTSTINTNSNSNSNSNTCLSNGTNTINSNTLTMINDSETNKGLIREENPIEIIHKENIATYNNIEVITNKNAIRNKNRKSVNNNADNNADNNANINNYNNNKKNKNNNNNNNNHNNNNNNNDNNNHNTTGTKLEYINWDTKRGSKSWSADEDSLLLRLKEVEKKNWYQIATYFPDRTTNGCQFRWRRLTIKNKNKEKRQNLFVKRHSENKDEVF
jgi:hypothetical protein